MRCLGRLVAFFLLLILLTGGWLYRGELMRWGREIVDPMSIARRTGTPSAASLERAHGKVADLSSIGPRDSIILSADELASLAVEGSSFLGLDAVDSLSIELGDRRIRVRALIDTGRLPQRLRNLIPGGLNPREEVIAEGPLLPERPGVAEWQFDNVIIRGLPVPADLVTRVMTEALGTGRDGRIRLTLPPEIHGFRVRPEGVAIYRGTIG